MQSPANAILIMLQGRANVDAYADISGGGKVVGSLTKPSCIATKAKGSHPHVFILFLLVQKETKACPDCDREEEV